MSIMNVDYGSAPAPWLLVAPGSHYATAALLSAESFLVRNAVYRGFRNRVADEKHSALLLLCCMAILRLHLLDQVGN